MSPSMNESPSTAMRTGVRRAVSASRAQKRYRGPSASVSKSSIGVSVVNNRAVSPVGGSVGGSLSAGVHSKASCGAADSVSAAGGSAAIESAGRGASPASSCPAKRWKSPENSSSSSGNVSSAASLSSKRRTSERMLARRSGMPQIVCGGMKATQTSTAISAAAWKLRRV